MNGLIFDLCLLSQDHFQSSHGRAIDECSFWFRIYTWVFLSSISPAPWFTSIMRKHQRNSRPPPPLLRTDRWSLISYLPNPIIDNDKSLIFSSLPSLFTNRPSSLEHWAASGMKQLHDFLLEACQEHFVARPFSDSHFCIHSHPDSSFQGNASVSIQFAIRYYRSVMLDLFKKNWRTYGWFAFRTLYPSQADSAYSHLLPSSTQANSFKLT